MYEWSQDTVFSVRSWLMAGRSGQGEDFPSPKPLDWLCGPPSLLFPGGKSDGT